MLRGKKILIGVTGGIAAYKIPQLVRDLIKLGASVKIVMTDSAAKFVSPLTLSTLSLNEVVVGSFPKIQSGILKGSTWHISLAQWANIMLIAPATANTIAKLAHGYADNAVTTLALAVRCPVLIAPSMDEDMYTHSLTENNIAILKEIGYHIIEPEQGELASGLVGKGRLPNFVKIRKKIEDILSFADQDLRGKKILVTAGPTYEPIDPVRFIGNRSSGKMGFALAAAASQRGADVTLITGHVNLQTPKNVQRINVLTSHEMLTAVKRNIRNKDAVIMAAAVADFTPLRKEQNKIKKDNLSKTISIELRQTTDILKYLSSTKGKFKLVGFAVETQNGISNAMKKLKEKKLDMIVLNNPLEHGAGFETDTNIVTIITKSGKIERLKKMPKYDVAQYILNKLSKFIN